ncbi:putative papain-like cysteine peptidase superfamily [Helianthus anomalus]
MWKSGRYIYAKNVKLQHDTFANYLRLKKHLKDKIMKSAPVVRQKMELRTKSNVVDCGVFAMRYMETYMEQIAGWTCGLAKEDAPNQLQQRLLNEQRMKYIVKIMLHSENENRTQVTKSVRKILNLGGKE